MIIKDPWHEITDEIDKEVLGKHRVKNIYASRFKCYDDLLDTAEHGDTVGWNKAIGRDLSSRNKGNKGFYGTETFEEAMNFARNGWEEGRKKLIESNKQYEFYRKMERTPGDTVDMVGAFPIVPLYCADDPCHMAIVKEDIKNKQKVITFYVDISAPCGISSNTLLNRGAAVHSVVNELETLGFSCDIIMTTSYESSSGRSNELMRTEVPVKTAGYGIEPDRLAFALIHPSFFRRVGFAIIEKANEKVAGIIGPYYGNNSDLARNFFISLAEHQRAVYLPPLDYGTAKTFEKPSIAGLDYVRERVAKTMGYEQYSMLVEAA